MLIPSIDLMGGKIVQLVQGETKAYETTEFDEWCDRFAGFPLVQLIDLDAAKRQGDNRPLIARILQRLPCQVGGGVRDLANAQGLLAIGAKRVIVGSSLIREAKPDTEFARFLADTCGVGTTLSPPSIRAQDALRFAAGSKPRRLLRRR